MTLANTQLQFRKAPFELGKNGRQQIRPDRRNDAELQRTAQKICVVACIVVEITDGSEDLTGTPGDFTAQFGDGDGALPAFHKLAADRGFELLYLLRQRGLGNETFLRGPSKMAMASEAFEIAQLFQCGHPIRITYRSGNEKRFALIARLFDFRA